MFLQTLPGESEAFVLLIGFGCVFLFAYFVPYFVARFRKGKNCAAIFVINLFLGWTLLGWVGALVWAVMTPKEQDDVINASLGSVDIPAYKIVPLGSREPQLYQNNLVIDPVEKSPSSNYQIAREGQVLGRKTPEEISNLLVDGKLSLDDSFLNEQTGGWDKIRQIKNLPL